MKINELIKEAHENAVLHGWWEKPKSMGELLVLVISEATEALEEHRNGHKAIETYYSGKKKVLSPDYKGDKESISYITTTKSIDSELYVGEGLSILSNKPEGIPSELADIVIRVCDMCGWYGIDLEAAIKEKMEYNKNRPYKHGGKKL